MKKYLGIVILLITGMVFAEGKVDDGRLKAMVCAGCHGTEGNSTQAIFPKLAGQSEQYIIRELKEIKKGAAGKREIPAMTAIASSLTDQDIEDVAAYFSSLKMSPGTADPKLVEKGQNIYRGGNLALGIPACSACHGPIGHGNAEAGFPAIAGQHVEYITAQLKAFRDGKRKDDIAGMMTDISKRLTDDEINAVASYIQGLHAK